jgi:hypothetical protein
MRAFIDYNTYLRAFTQTQAQIFRELMNASRGQPEELASRLRDLAFRVRQATPLLQDQYDMIQGAIRSLPSIPQTISQAWLNAGRIFVQEHLVPATAFARLFVHEGPIFVAVSHRLFAFGPDLVAHGLAHEVAHYYNWLQGTPSDDIYPYSPSDPVPRRACGWYHYAAYCS